jgi:hypothetical protein
MMLKKLIENTAENNDVKRVIADGAYNNNENFSDIFLIMALKPQSR